MTDWEALLAARERELDALPPATAKMCAECPWSRKARPGHLGPNSAELWVEMAHGEAAIACHTTITNSEWSDKGMRQCQGSAIFRANICKTPRHPNIAVADKTDRINVFSWDNEFIDHHKSV